MHSLIAHLEIYIKFYPKELQHTHTPTQEQYRKTESFWIAIFRYDSWKTIPLNCVALDCRSKVVFLVSYVHVNPFNFLNGIIHNNSLCNTLVVKRICIPNFYKTKKKYNFHLYAIKSCAERKRSFVFWGTVFFLCFGWSATLDQLPYCQCSFCYYLIFSVFDATVSYLFFFVIICCFLQLFNINM